MKTKNAIYGIVLALTCSLGSTATLTAQNLYVINGSGLGEYGLNGQAINSSLIPATGLRLPIGIAFSGSDMFIANEITGTIGEYTTSGATVNSSLISGF